VTVGAFRTKLSTVNAGSTTPDPVPRVSPPNLGDLNSWCNWTSAPGTNETLPLNCIGQPKARKYCHTLGRELLTEAQYEFVASGRGQNLLYPWGSEVPSCADSVWGRGGGVIGQSAIGFNDGTCRGSLELGGSVLAGQGRLDRILLGDTRTVLDLAGNLSEWAVDTFSRQDEPYWSKNGLFKDPVADVASTAEPSWVSVARGGNWQTVPVNLRAITRNGMPDGSYSVGIGFRCAGPAP
jgi:formylglycine-generating enzyme required for sulfatase activity